jgi:hypothetical protein
MIFRSMNELEGRHFGRIGARTKTFDRRWDGRGAVESVADARGCVYYELESIRSDLAIRAPFVQDCAPGTSS